MINTDLRAYVRYRNLAKALHAMAEEYEDNSAVRCGLLDPATECDEAAEPLLEALERSKQVLLSDGG